MLNLQQRPAGQSVGYFMPPEMGVTPWAKLVAVLGLGDAGLAAALVLLGVGYEVIGVDPSDSVVAEVASGSPPLAAADRRRLILARKNPGFDVTTALPALNRADVVLICAAPDDVREACAVVVANARAGQTFILESNLPVGATGDLLVDPLAAAGFELGFDVFVAYTPRREGARGQSGDQRMLPRVLGGYTSDCARRAAPVSAALASRVHLLESLEAAERTQMSENFVGGIAVG